MAPETIALSVALGLVLGVFPVFGCPTILCALAAFALVLNLPAIQAVNYLAYPLQLALLVPFIRLGGGIFRFAPGAPTLLTAALHAIVAWFCVCVPAGLLLYVLLYAALRNMTTEPRASASGGHLAVHRCKKVETVLQVKRRIMKDAILLTEISR
jgi:uncharacterized protein (DUF2062 family)